MGYNLPENIAIEFSKINIAKAKMPFIQFVLLAFLGGAFIAFGGLLTVVVAGGMPEMATTNPGLVKLMSGALFPVGLILVTVAGADLFTSDCAGTTLAFLQKKIDINAVCKILIISYIFNFIGAQFIAYFLSAKIGLYNTDFYKYYLYNMGEMKVNQSFFQIFVKGIGANWLVCLGAWMGFAGKDIVSKCVGIWLPVMVFVTLGYEHSIANMYFIPAAIYSGADISWFDFLIKNLIPATLGNIVGGAGLVGCIYWYVYMKNRVYE